MIDSKMQVPTQGSFLQQNAMLVKLTRKKFNHNKLDKELSKKLVKELKVKGKNAVRVNKTIIPSEAVKSWMDVYTEAGTYYYKVTLAWDDASWRLLPVVKYKEFVKKFREYSTRVDAAIDDFIHRLPEWIDKGMEELGQAGQKTDYPNSVEVRQSFSFGVDYNTISIGNDFRAQVTEEEREEITKAITAQNAAKFALAQESIFVRIHEAAKAIADKMDEGPDGVFRDTLITNVQELVDVLPSLNVNNNPDIDALITKLNVNLAGIDPQDLRDCDRMKVDTGDKAKAIVEQAQGFMS